EAQVQAGERSERTLEHYRYCLSKHLLPLLGSRRVQTLSTDDCARLIAQLRSKGLSAKTISSCLVPLGRVLALALRRGHIQETPPDASRHPNAHASTNETSASSPTKRSPSSSPPASPATSP